MSFPFFSKSFVSFSANGAASKQFSRLIDFAKAQVTQYRDADGIAKAQVTQYRDTGGMTKAQEYFSRKIAQSVKMSKCQMSTMECSNEKKRLRTRTLYIIEIIYII